MFRTTNSPKINLDKLIYDQDPGIDIAGNRGDGADLDAAVGATEDTYIRNGFQPLLDPCGESAHDPAGTGGGWQIALDSDPNLTYTSARKLKMVGNTYPNLAGTYSVFCYVGNWAQYDNRYEAYAEVLGGRGFDYPRLGHLPYDKIVMGFLGHTGYPEKGNHAVIANNAGVTMGVSTGKGSATFTDPNGDTDNYRNCGFTTWIPNLGSTYDESNTQGMLGALRDISDHGASPSLSLSLGGWSMSYAFSDICLPGNSDLQNNLVASINVIREKLPMFSGIDLDWEYPGSAGVGNDFDPSDGANFAALIQTIYNQCGQPNISIAISANLETLAAAHIKETMSTLKSCGVRFNVMSYDMFTISDTADSPLAHHTNLYADDGVHSTQAAVDYLINECGADSNKIFIGYAGYSRSARNADKALLTEISPLTGTYSLEGQSTTGTFEYGVTELPDLLTNYLDLEGMVASIDDGDPNDDIVRMTANQIQFNNTGFILCTDTVADADFLHCPSTGLFMSIDTPRSVYKKAQYVVANSLGGLFIWTGDQDNGLLANAAWEGLGETAASGPTLEPNNSGIFNTAPYYAIRGVTTRAEYDQIVNGYLPPEPPKPGLTVPREPSLDSE